MNDEIAESVTEVEVYWRPGCPFCMALRGPLRRTGLPLREVNIWQDQDAAGRVRAATGGDETVPTVFIGTRALVNPSVRQVKAAVAEDAPWLLDVAETSRNGPGTLRKLFGGGR